MKKILTILRMLSLTIVVAFGIPSLSTSAASSKEDAELTMAQTRTINYSVIYRGNITPPATYYYHKGGWSGTLKRMNWKYDGTYTITIYSGKVTCNGSCVAPSSVEGN